MNKMDIEADTRRSANSNHDSIIVDVTKVVASSIKMNPLWSHGFRESTNSCIFTVPYSLSKHNPGAYKPIMFSIGPLHHFDQHLKDTQNIKFQYLSGLVSRSGIQVEDMITAVAKLEQEAREHYGEQIKLSQTEFVEMMVVDGCFIIELLRKQSRVVDRERKDPVLDRITTLQDLTQDMMLLENQIPWTILHKLFTMTSINPDESLVHLAIDFLEYSFDIFCNPRQELAHFLESVNCHHMLDLARYILIFLTTSGLDIETDHEVGKSIPTATELENAGVTLKKSQSKKGLAISFKDGVLEISPFQIYDETEGLFRNLIAFEQCCINCQTLISSYAFILDDLIKTTQDINCLSSNNIIKVQISPDDGLGFFNKLCNGVTLNRSFYPNLASPLNAYSRRRWPRWRATLIRNYFSNPWVIISTFAAFVLLVLTFLQTVYTMKGQKFFGFTL